MKNDIGMYIILTAVISAFLIVIIVSIVKATYWIVGAELWQAVLAVLGLLIVVVTAFLVAYWLMNL